MKKTQMQIFHGSIIYSIALALIITLPYVSSSHQSYRALVSSITKDTTTSLYTMTLNSNETYVIDLESPFSWYHCPKQHPRVSCSSSQCSEARAYPSPGGLCRPSNRAGDGSHRHNCSCVVAPVNSVTHMCALAELTYKDLIIYWTNGQTPTVATNFHHSYLSCAPKSLLRSLPVGCQGMASLSQSPLSLTTQFPSKVKKQVSICLPSTATARGVLFFGEGPFYLLPPPPFQVNVTTLLSYTPLIKKLTSLGYYISLAAISINQKRSRIPKRAFELDRQRHHGGVKLDTVVPYTTMRRDIYERFLEDFSKATNGIPRARKVKPFDLCMNTTTLGSTRVGLPVPQIDLELGNGKNWTIFGANSMKQVSNDVACLAFVDGGVMADQAVVIGSFQMEDNFLMFDLVESKLGFSSTLLGIRTTCSNFNFTTSQ